MTLLLKVAVYSQEANIDLPLSISLNYKPSHLHRLRSLYALKNEFFLDNFADELYSGC